jgi:hypothetical protein
MEASMKGLERFSGRWARGAAALAVLLALALSVSACTRGFDPFNKVDKLRVLAVRAEPPALAPGESAELAALVYEPDGDELEYRWSWCPLPTTSLNGYECPLDEEQFAALVEQLIPGAGALVPSFELSLEPEAAFHYVIDPDLLQQVCEATQSADVPGLELLPDCERSLAITISLEVSAGGESVTAIKELPIFFDGQDADNENPSIGEVTAAHGGGPESVLDEDEPSSLIADRRYDVTAEVSLSNSQTFQPEPTDDDPDPVPERESLFMTWFVTGGSTDSKRTTFIDGEVGLDVLENNSWQTPDAAAAGTLFLVLQDERGGVGWTWRDVELLEE